METKTLDGAASSLHGAGAASLPAGANTKAPQAPRPAPEPGASAAARLATATGAPEGEVEEVQPGGGVECARRVLTMRDVEVALDVVVVGGCVGGCW